MKYLIEILRTVALCALLAYLNTAFHLTLACDLLIAAVCIVWALSGYVAGLDEVFDDERE